MNSLTFSYDGKRLIAAGAHQVVVLQLPELNCQAEFVLPGGADLSGAAIVRGKTDTTDTVFAASRDGLILKWKVGQTKPVAIIDAKIGPLTSLSVAKALVPQSNGSSSGEVTLLAVSGTGREARIYDGEGPFLDLVFVNSGSIRAVHFGAEAGTLVLATGEALYVFDRARSETREIGQFRDLISFAVSAGGNGLVTGSTDGWVKTWSVLRSNRSLNRTTRGYLRISALPSIAGAVPSRWAVCPPPLGLAEEIKCRRTMS